MPDQAIPRSENDPLSHQILLVVNFALLTVAFLLLFDVVIRYTGPSSILDGGVGLSMEMLASAILSGSMTFVGRRLLIWRGRGYLSADILILFASITLIFFAIFSWTRLEPAAKRLNQEAHELHQQGELQHAKTLYLRAARLLPENPQIQYNLGSLYEDLADFTAAETAYLAAIDGRMEVAYNNLGRLLILSDRPNEAAKQLQLGLERVEAQPVRYTLYKNLGWAQMEQLLYEEADASLQQAIEIFPEKGAAHCLLAQLRERQERFEEEGASRLACQRYADPTHVDEAGWIGETRRRLEELAP